MMQWTVSPGEEVLATLEAQAEEAGVSNGAIVSLIGAVEGCRISNMAANDATKDIITAYTEPMELSGTGEIVDGRVHLHVAMSREGDVAVHGHLHEAYVKTFFVNAYVMVR